MRDLPPRRPPTRAHAAPVNRSEGGKRPVGRFTKAPQEEGGGLWTRRARRLRSSACRNILAVEPLLSLHCPPPHFTEKVYGGSTQHRSREQGTQNPNWTRGTWNPADRRSCTSCRASFCGGGAARQLSGGGVGGGQEHARAPFSWAKAALISRVSHVVYPCADMGWQL